MALEDIIETYGGCSDYMDMTTGNIFHIPDRVYDPQEDTTVVPVTLADGSSGIVTLKGNH